MDMIRGVKLLSIFVYITDRIPKSCKTLGCFYEGDTFFFFFFHFSLSLVSVFCDRTWRVGEDKVLENICSLLLKISANFIVVNCRLLS